MHKRQIIKLDLDLPTCMLLMYTHLICIKHTSIHIYAHNLQVSIKIVTPTKRHYVKRKHIVFHESCKSSTLIIKQSHMQTYLHQYKPTNIICIHFSRPKRFDHTSSRNSSILEFGVFADVELFLSLSLSLFFSFSFLSLSLSLLFFLSIFFFSFLIFSLSRSIYLSIYLFIHLSFSLRRFFSFFRKIHSTVLY